MVEPTPLKNMIVKLAHLPQVVKLKNIWNHHLVVLRENIFFVIACGLGPRECVQGHFNGKAMPFSRETAVLIGTFQLIQAIHSLL